MIENALITIEMKEKWCKFCTHPARYIIFNDCSEKFVCGIHMRKKEFINSNILELKDFYKCKIERYLKNEC